jgi:hypothetical protein
VPVSKGNKPDVGLKDVAGAMVRIADSLDRLTWVVENLAVGLDLVHPDDIGPSEKAQKIAET